eukprot:CAMPEP_0203826956 /NCGR_PEP_ID=MMETSP0115-20131106/57782_1 /ASSEMBLY_ACC=CAM_ASM_000227 /TAXON_ID=33651 /ORGANISM="Bicosoecid sp, Strain ms1" /LENGTH=150 /DNA_ID=CAMNT_0050736011 /DNA_START=136 /DNA_END=585 /DNA_ORIENTATION=+
MSAGIAIGGPGQPTLYSEVRQARINKEGSTFVEYEVCALTRVPAPGKGFKAETKKWAVWQRYSAFVELDAALRAKYGWQMDHIKLPPKKTFGNTKPDFVERRRVELQVYLQAVLKIKNITEFQKHFGSEDLANFFQYHDHVGDAAGGGGG